MSRIDMLRKCLTCLTDHAVEMSDAEVIAAILDCPSEAAQEWLARYGAPDRSLTATREVADRLGLNWQHAMDAAAHALRHRQGWTLDEAAPYALIWIVERLIDREAGAADGDCTVH